VIASVCSEYRTDAATRRYGKKTSMENNQKSALQSDIISGSIHALVVLTIVAWTLYLVTRYKLFWGDFGLELSPATRVVVGIVNSVQNYRFIFFPIILLVLVGNTMPCYSIRAKAGKLYALLYSIAILCLLFLVAVCILVSIEIPTINLINCLN
jgi:hypothetical protein